MVQYPAVAYFLLSSLPNNMYFLDWAQYLAALKMLKKMRGYDNVAEGLVVNAWMRFILADKEGVNPGRRSQIFSARREESMYMFIASFCRAKKPPKNYRGILLRDYSFRESQCTQRQPRPYWIPPQGLDNRNDKWRNPGSWVKPKEVRMQETQGDFQGDQKQTEGARLMRWEVNLSRNRNMWLSDLSKKLGGDCWEIAVPSPYLNCRKT